MATARTRPHIIASGLGSVVKVKRVMRSVKVAYASTSHSSAISPRLGFASMAKSCFMNFIIFLWVICMVSSYNHPFSLYHFTARRTPSFSL